MVQEQTRQVSPAAKGVSRRQWQREELLHKPWCQQTQEIQDATRFRWICVTHAKLQVTSQRHNQHPDSNASEYQWYEHNAEFHLVSSLDPHPNGETSWVIILACRDLQQHTQQHTLRHQATQLPRTTGRPHTMVTWTISPPCSYQSWRHNTKWRHPVLPTAATWDHIRWALTDPWPPSQFIAATQAQIAWTTRTTVHGPNSKCSRLDYYPWQWKHFTKIVNLMFFACRTSKAQHFRDHSWRTGRKNQAVFSHRNMLLTKRVWNWKSSLTKINPCNQNRYQCCADVINICWLHPVKRGDKSYWKKTSRRHGHKIKPDVKRWLSWPRKRKDYHQVIKIHKFQVKNKTVT